MQAIQIKAVYVNRQGHRVQPYQFDNRGGQVNQRLYAHNFTTGYDEAWSTSLFVAEHTPAQKVAPMTTTGREAERWYRIDKSTGRMEYIGRTGSAAFGYKVLSAATQCYGSGASDVITTGRFSTPFALYVREDQMTAEERPS